MSLESIRAKLRDRETKAGARGTESVTVCLNIGAVQELKRLEADLAIARAMPAQGKARLGQPARNPEPDAVELGLLDQVEAARAECREWSLRLVFRSLASTKYQELLNTHPNANDSEGDKADFFNDLCSACLWQVWEWEGDQEVQVVGLTWDEIRISLEFGEWDLTVLKVSALNQRVVDAPFSLKPSPKTAG